MSGLANSHIDHILVHYGEDVLWQENRQPVRKSKSGPPIMVRPKMGSSITPVKVRDHIQALCRQAPQVMVKITGGGPDMRRIGSHIDYIARGGKYKKKDMDELAIETNDGVAQGAQARQVLKDLFAMSGKPIAPEVHDNPKDATFKRRQRREALNMILSMPHGIQRETVKAAARATVKELFGDRHVWGMVHHEDTDHQHTHVVIKMVGHDGTRLNPKKADLEAWRIAFAKQLQARGIDAVATRRRVRLKRRKGESQAVRQIKDRGLTPERTRTSITQTLAQQKAKENEERVKVAYTEIGKALAQSPDAADRKLANGLQSYLKQQGHNVRIAPPTKGISL